ncbi:MAG TPA: hypothetical protein VF483_02075 [Gemmatimonadaceae bacterium]
MRRLTLLSLIALTGCLKPHNVVTAPTPHVAVAQQSSASVHVAQVATPARSER